MAKVFEIGPLLLRKAPAWAAALCLAVLIGCAGTPLYRTLYSTGRATDAAIDRYYVLVKDGAVPTNDVPIIAGMYDQFQTMYRAAEVRVQFDPTARADSNITARAIALIQQIEKSKGGIK